MATPIWDELQKKAKILENDIDAKLLSLNKINSSATTGSNVHHQIPLNKRSLFDSLTAEIESQISKLTRNVDEMRNYVEANDLSSAKNSSIVHMLRRHSDLLTDYSAEFSRTSTNIKNQLDRDELFEEVHSKDTDPLISNRANRSNDYLLKENESIKNTDRLLNEQISIAMSVKENVLNQGSGLNSVNRRLHQLARRYPAINSVLQKIRFKKRKDTIVLAAVISTCLILFFLYAMR